MRGRLTVLVLATSFLAVQAAAASVAHSPAPVTLAAGTSCGEDIDTTCDCRTPGQAAPRLVRPSWDELTSSTAALSVSLLRVPAFLANCTFLL